MHFFHGQNSLLSKLLNKKPKSAQALGMPVMKPNDFRAIKIVSSDKRMCEAAKALSDKVYLCREAPWLPLDLCTNSNNCFCRYTHLDDRRSAMRRDVDNGLPGFGVDTERRRRGDRRRSLA